MLPRSVQGCVVQTAHIKLQTGKLGNRIVRLTTPRRFHPNEILPIGSFCQQWPRQKGYTLNLSTDWGRPTWEKCCLVMQHVVLIWLIIPLLIISHCIIISIANIISSINRQIGFLLGNIARWTLHWFTQLYVFTVASASRCSGKSSLCPDVRIKSRH